MRSLLQTVSGLALAGTILPPLLHVSGVLTLDAVKVWMAVSAAVWFAATPFWMET